VGKKDGIWDYLAIICCLIVPMAGILIFLFGALYGSILIILIGLALLTIPLAMAWVAMSIRNALGGKKNEDA